MKAYERLARAEYRRSVKQHAARMTREEYIKWYAANIPENLAADVIAANKSGDDAAIKSANNAIALHLGIPESWLQ